MKLTVYGLIFCFSATISSACSIVAENISGPLSAAFDGVEIAHAELEDTDSHEPILRYVGALPNGAVFMLDQRHCSIYNIDLSVLRPSTMTDQEIASVMVSGLSAVPEWAEWTGSADIQSALSEAMNALKEDHIQPLTTWTERINPSLEVILFDTTPPNGAPFGGLVSLRVSVGGN